ncbi:MAG TPA: holo-[acyl-carrier-protein] synthase [Anaerolineae bacterium]|nr:holo-[acyl-carrier-protein] synthase [Anaerolineae bacterium]HCC78847.1 holo-[acyl-carrier-protein] synthase [Anaerolineae bacterium]HCM97153.1 holo-[acyl-carrier-protein] synthase [Anaerolineae bacterium]
MLRSGIDLIEIDRLENSIKRHGERFLKRIFTAQELVDCGGNVESLSVRFAAKEAASKALGCGIGQVSWLEIEVKRNADHQPELVLHGAARALAKKLKLTLWSVSLSHTHQNAIAMVIACGEN